ncbi:MAG TPA: uroporphyrinogen-III synthase [Bacteroidales bacterium]|jgi:uroporphyrinogen-III synthase|nr:uroporphyrinogen-III synthase [Bacteroidales bacterium]MDD4086217.1 uroporphyrinogen-III synthase [Bacteroidales bacterium]HPE42767.1 uroporphyrinogen-III synthase [Bacteroidales bacterium]
MKIKSILVSQPQPADLEKSPYGELARKYNLTIDFEKFIKIEGVPAREFRQDRVSLADHTAIILTSRNSVDHFFRIAKEMRYEVPETLKYFCISESTAFYLQKYVQYRKRKIFHGKQSFGDLMEIIKKHKDEKFLLPCSDIHKESMIEMLDESKVTYHKAVLYRTVAANLSKIKVDDYDMLVFFSPAGIRSLTKNFPKFKQGVKVFGAFGPSTAQAVKEAGFKLQINAPTKSAPSMTMAIEEYIDDQIKRARKK